MMQPEIVEGFRLSPQQRHLWLLQSNGHPDSVDAQPQIPYTSQCLVHLQGPLDKERLRVALSILINRYEILRTTFQYPPGMNLPVQVVAENQALQFTEFDLGELTEQAQWAEVERRFHGLPQTADDAGDALQTQLLALAPDSHALLLRLPGLCADSLSLNQLVADLSQTYQVVSDRRDEIDASDETALDEEAVQYADLAEWLNELLEDEEAELEQAYWRRADLASLLTLRLPLERGLRAGDESSSGSEFAPQQLAIEIEPALSSAIMALLNDQDATLADFFLACWTLLLARHSGRSDLLLGIACDGRLDEDLVDAVGLLTRYVPIFCRGAESASLIDLMTKAQTWLNEADELQPYFSWEALGDWVSFETEPYLPYCFAYAEQATRLDAGDLAFSLISTDSTVDRFHLKLICEKNGDRLTATLHYDANLFQPADIERLADQLTQLLHSAVVQPQAGNDRLSMLSERERQQLLVAFNETQAAFPQAECIHHLFETQAKQTPDAAAVVYQIPRRNQDGDDVPASVHPFTLTYRALNERANQLAHHLQSLGVGPETLVGLCVERSVEMVIGVLGVLKAGGAYVPLDPTYPTARLTFMLEDSRCPVVLTQQHLEESLSADHGITLCLDSDWEAIAGADKTNPSLTVCGDNLAYVIYTSGSTGQPKGVMIEHRGLVNYLWWAIQTYRVATGQGSLVHSPLGFDLTVTSLFTPLLVGQPAILLPEAEAIEALSQTLAKADALSLLKITPAHLDLLSQLLSAEQAAGRSQAFIIGGEALFGEHLAFWQTHAPATRLINEYGPTETVVGCCVYEAQPETPISGAVPIGQPIANTQLYVLDEYLNPVPLGVAGELYIGGVGVARGYLNRPALTTEKFIPDPFTARPGARLYRTGDLVRHSLDEAGDPILEFLGRLDHQVKIRGFRIELDEIEAVLVSHPQVQDAVVVVREAETSAGLTGAVASADKQLVAYVVQADKSTAATATEAEELTAILRAYLYERLPAYMIPAATVVLAALPLTPNGKVDLEALPAPDRTGSQADYVPPSTDTEKALVTIWTEVLNLEQIGIHDDFFDLGGHSLLATQVMSRLREAFNIDLSVRSLFEAPTVAALSRHLALTRQTLAQQTDPPAPLTEDEEEITI